MTRLTWTEQTNGKTSLNYAQAVAYCQQLDANGHTGWRLPTIDELKAQLMVGDSGPIETRRNGEVKSLPGPDPNLIKFDQSYLGTLWSSSPAPSGKIFTVSLGQSLFKPVGTSGPTSKFHHHAVCVSPLGPH